LATSIVARAYHGTDLDHNTVYSDSFEAYATAHDIYAYDNALFAGRLLSPPYLATFFTPRASIGQTDPGITSRGTGYLWQIGTALGRRVIYTNSVWDSFSTLNMRFPDAGVTIVICGNELQNSAEDVGLHVAALLFGEQPVSRPAIVTTVPGSLVGIYRRTFQNADGIAAHDPNASDWVGTEPIIEIGPGWVGFSPVSMHDGAAVDVAIPGFMVEEYFTATSAGRLTMTGYLPANQNSFCSDNPHQDPPLGVYRWSRRKNLLIISRTGFDPCLDRGALLPGQWTKIG